MAGVLRTAAAILTADAAGLHGAELLLRRCFQANRRCFNVSILSNRCHLAPGPVVHPLHFVVAGRELRFMWCSLQFCAALHEALHDCCVRQQSPAVAKSSGIRPHELQMFSMRSSAALRHTTRRPSAQVWCPLCSRAGARRYFIAALACAIGPPLLYAVHTPMRCSCAIGLLNRALVLSCSSGRASPQPAGVCKRMRRQSSGASCSGICSTKHLGAPHVPPPALCLDAARLA